MKKFFSAFLLMTAMVLSVGTFVACNDLTEEMETVQTQATSNAAAIKALGDQITALQQALATANGEIEKAKAAGEEAKAAAAQAKADAIKAAEEECQELKAALEAKINENAQGLKDLTAVVSAKIAGIEEELDKMATVAQVEKAVADLVKADTELGIQIEALKKYAADSLATIAQLEGLREDLTELAQESHAELSQLIGSTAMSLSSYMQDNDNAVNALDSTVNVLKGDVKKLEEGLKALEGRMTAAETAIAKINKDLVTLKTFVEKSLRGLVFIPEFYFDGIESTEYTYMYAEETLTSKKTTVNTTDKQGVAVKIAERTGLKYEAAVNSKGEKIVKYVNPVEYVSYWINPSNADITGADLAFISKDVASVTTKASAAAPTVAGEFKVAQQKDDEGKERNYIRVPMKASGEFFNNAKKYSVATANIFALSAGIKANAKDTTIVSDYARVLPAQLNLEGVAYAKTNTAVDCAGKAPKFDHLYATAEDALKNDATLKVKYDSSIDLRKEIVTHYTVNGGDVKVYEADFMAEGTPADEQNPYGLVWSFEAIDYIAGTNATSDTQYCTLNGSVLTPCGVTNGVADGTTSITSVGRRPLVRVTVTVDDAIILVGFIKLEITREVSCIIADETAFDVQFGFENDNAAEVAAAPVQGWEEFDDNVLDVVNLSNEEFHSMYKLQTVVPNDPKSPAVQYYATADAFKAFEDTKIIENNVIVAHEKFGTINEVDEVHNGATINVLKWTLDAAVQQRIFEANAEHTVTVYVRYVKKTDNAPSTNLEGVFVPLKVTVNKPQGNVTKKIAEYWFNGEKNAMLNVLKPTDGKNTIDWVSDIKEVWQGNKHNFNAPATIEKSIAYEDTKWTKENYSYVDGYKYYFAAEQPVIGAYQLMAGVPQLEGTYNDVKALAVAFAESAVAYIHADYNYFRVKSPIAVTNATLPATEYSYALDYEKGVYTNTALYAVKVVNKKYDVEQIATIDQTTGDVTYLNSSEVAKVLLNMYPSVPRTDAKLYANIGVAANLGDLTDNVVFSLKDATDAYNFLRPINVAPKSGAKFVDGQDNGSTVNVMDLLQITDWRKEDFAKKVGSNYVNGWYFAFYGVKSVTVNTSADAVLCDLNQADDTFVKLADVTTKILIEQVPGAAVANPTDYNAAAKGNAAYTAYQKAFGVLRYQNNGNAVSNFNIKVPVTLTYDWGEITVDAVIPVVETMGNK